MTLKEYIRVQINKKVPLEVIYEEMPRLGYKTIDIYTTVNEILLENIEKAYKDYLRKKNEKE